MKTTIKKTLMLRDEEIGKYISVPPNATKEHIEKKLAELEKQKKDMLPCEVDAVEDNKIKILRSYYPIIDLRFLQKSNQIDSGKKYDKHKRGFLAWLFILYEEKPIMLNVPVFSVYGINSAPTLTIIMQVRYGRVEARIIFGNSARRTIFNKYILSSLGFNFGSGVGVDGFLSYFSETNHEDYEDLSFKIEITSYFNTIVPQATKKKINEAEKYFGLENIFIIAETKPEEWNCNVIQDDPIIVGIMRDTAFLIDHFNGSIIEQSIVNSFGNQN